MMPIILSYVSLCIIWGTTWLAIKIGLAEFPPFLFAAVRCIFAAGILFTIVRIRREEIPLKLQSLKGPMVFGLMNGMGLGLVFWGEQFITSSLTATLNAALPFFSAIFAYFLVGENFTTRKFIGLALGFVGVLIIFAENLGGFAGEKVLGEVAVVFSCVLYSLGGAYAKSHHSDLKQAPAVTIQQLFSAVALLPVALLLEHNAKIVVTTPAVLAFLYLVVFGSVIAFLLYYYLLVRIEFTKLSYISMVTPGVATLIGVGWGNETLKVQYLLGLIIICIGMAVVNSKVGWRTKRVIE
jgi:drug/metabolite transporter (DMT)-like permease